MTAIARVFGSSFLSLVVAAVLGVCIPSTTLAGDDARTRYANRIAIPPSSCALETPPSAPPRLSAHVRAEADMLYFDLRNDGSQSLCIWSPFGQPYFPDTLMMVHLRDEDGRKSDLHTASPHSQLYSPDEMRPRMVRFPPGAKLQGRYDLSALRVFIGSTALRSGFENEMPMRFDLLVTYQERVPPPGQPKIIDSASRGLKELSISPPESCFLRVSGETYSAECKPADSPIRQ